MKTIASVEMVWTALLVLGGLALGLSADLFVAGFWPRLKQKFYSPFDEKKTSWRLHDIFYFVLGYSILQLAFGFSLLAVNRRHLVAEKTLHYVALFWATFGVNFLVISTLLIYLKKRYGVRLKNLGLRARNLISQIGLGILSYVAFLPLFFLLVLVSSLLCALLGIEPKPHEVVEIFRTEKSVWVLAWLALFAAVVGPLFEELFFRGFVYPVFKKNWGRRGGMFLTALFFAAVHGNAFQFLPVLGLGLLLTFLYEATGSLVASITLHALNNTISVVLALYLLQNGALK